MTMDPITIEVVASRLREAAATMEYALYHSGYSPILRESKDGTAGITDAQGRVIMLSGGLQYHFTAYEQGVKALLARYPAETLKPGESFVCNDPYTSGSPHAPDFCAISPAFHKGILIGFGVSLAHKSDIGGLVPGSSGAAAREIYHDGILLPPVRFNDDIQAVIGNNSRVAEVVLGDLRAQVGCTRVGGEKLAALCEEYGREVVTEVMARLLDLTGRRVRGELASWKDGESSTEGFLDHDGVDRDRPIRVAVRAVKAGDSLTLDFTGTSPQALGPVNLVACTTRAAALMAVLTSCDPTIPVNNGLSDLIDFVLPEGTFVNPRHPATVNLYFPSAHLIYNVVLSALASLNPVRAVAPSGLGSGAVTIGYRKARSGKPAVMYELLNTSLGGTSTHDGAAVVMAMNHFTPGAPVEIFESEYPIRIRAFELVRDSAGAGQFRGGLGYAREFEVLEDSTLTVRSSNHHFTSQGLMGGAAGKPSRVILNPHRPDAEELGPLETRFLKAGDVIRFERAGGAGYGPVSQRDADLVREDVRNGYVSFDAAQAKYSVSVEARGKPE
jgi:N-methylhydantoinase B